LNKTATTNTYRGTTESLVKAGTTTYSQGATGSPLGQKVGTAAASYFLADPHGDTVGLVSTTATNQGTTAFDPWGRVLGTTGVQATFGFQSDLTDALTKAVDMGTRWYVPSQGAFSSRDVLFGDPMSPPSLNLWGYGGANPITMHDPTGMLPIAGNESTQEDANRYSEGSSSSSSWGSAASEPDPVVPQVPMPSGPRRFVDGKARDLLDALLNFLEEASETEARYLVTGAGAGFSASPASELWISKGSALARRARFLRGGGGALLLLGGWLDYGDYRSDGDSRPAAAGKAATKMGAAFAGSGTGATLGGGACLATVALAPVAWACAGLGAIGGGAYAYFAAETLLDERPECGWGYVDPAMGCVSVTDVD
jgi:RHS repeat-associated protein